jgi:hypothetical protein
MDNERDEITPLGPNRYSDPCAVLWGFQGCDLIRSVLLAVVRDGVKYPTRGFTACMFNRTGVCLLGQILDPPQLP